MRLQDRSVALLWWVGCEDPTKGMTAASICRELELAGHPRQNVSRLDSMLKAHRGTSKAGSDGWRLHPRTRHELDPEYAFALKPKPVPTSDSVLPVELEISAASIGWRPKFSE